MQSLTARMLVISSIVLLVFLGLTGFSLNRAFTQSAISSAEENRRTSIYVLISGVIAVIDESVVVARVEDSRFHSINSGVYGFILNENGQVTWRSDSTNNLGDISEIQLDEPTIGAIAHQNIVLNGQELYLSRFPVNWAVEQTNFHLDFVVAQPKNEVLAQVSSFRITLFQGLIISSVALMAILLMLLVGSLKPLRQVAHELKLIRRAKREKLVGNYPQELLPLTENLNELLETERKQRERYRHKLGDLAHSLKTPLAVIQGMAMDERLPEELQIKVVEQVQRMDEVIRYQLQRAVSEQQALALKTRIPLLPVAKKIARLVDQAWRDKDIDWQWRGDDIKVRMDEDDLMEVLGNLIENAAKYGQGKVLISTAIIDGHACLAISDNGAGIAEEDRSKVFKRGVRVDTLTTGQGIGLAVVDDILHSYRVEHSITECSELGGAKFTLFFD